MSANSEFLSVSEQLTALSSAEAMKRLLTSLRVLIPNAVAELYILSLESSQLEAVDLETKALPDSFRISEIDIFKSLAVESNKNTEFLPVHRGKNLIALLVFNAKNIGTEDFNSIRNFLSLCPFLYNRVQHERFVSSFHKPIAFQDVQPSDFYEGLGDLAHNSAGTRFGALRRIRGSKLETVFHWGFGKSHDERNLFDIDIDDINEIKESISAKIPVACSNLREGAIFSNEKYVFLQEVVSFISIPVEIGTDIYGVFTIGLDFEYNFSAVEREMFFCMANSLGVAISNFKGVWEGKTRGAEFERISNQLMGLEIAQTLRHNIDKSAGVILSQLRLAEKKLSSSTINSTKASDVIEKHIRVAHRRAGDIEEEIQKMREVGNPQRIIMMTNIKDLWEEAKAYLDFQLEAVGASVNTVEKEKCGHPFMPDIVKYIFHNLLLNSLDAAEGINYDLKISLSIENNDTKNKKIHLRYIDNGPGLDIGNLIVQRDEMAKDFDSDITENDNVGDLIFRLGFSTKKKSSGYGLYICRQMAKYHGGSVAYRTPNSGKGAIFQISLSYDLDQIEKENSGKSLFFFNKKGEKVSFNKDYFLAQTKK